MPETSRLVLEPISVVMPPRIAANDSDISSFDEGWPSRSASACMIGIKITTTGVLLRNPLTTRTAINAIAGASAG